jgi:hypothetical protein
MTDQFPTFRRWSRATRSFLATPKKWAGLPEVLSSLGARQPPKLTLGWKQWFALMGLLGGLLLVVYVAVPSNPIRLWYWMRVVGPAQERRFGFHASLGVGSDYCLQVTQVEPNGAFTRAGIQPGWAFFTPNCLGLHSGEIVFSQLRSAEAPSITLLFLKAGCNGSHAAESVFRAKIPVQRGAA